MSPNAMVLTWKQEIEKGIKPSSLTQSILEGKQMEDPSMDREILHGQRTFIFNVGTAWGEFPCL
jgi:hypothetical protein